MEKETIEEDATSEEETSKNETEEVEDVDALKERMAKLESDNENYKKALVSKKLNKFSLEEEKEEVKEEETEWNDESQKFQKETERKAQLAGESAGEKAARRIIEGHNEKKAISKYLEDNPEMLHKLDEIKLNYRSKHGRETWEDILKDIKNAHAIFKYENGGLVSPEEVEKAKAKGKAEAQLSNLSTVPRTSSQKDDKKPLSSAEERSERLAERMPPGFKYTG